MLDRDILEKYVKQNLEQVNSETDLFTGERYVQFHRFLQRDAKTILDVHINTGRGGQRLAELNSVYKLTALDCVQSRLEALPKCYCGVICGLSNAIPAEDQSFDAIVAGEFLEHLYPSDVDPTLCEFQRVPEGRRPAINGARPNPAYVRLWLSGGTVYTVSHLTQHWPGVLKSRLQAHGFSRSVSAGSGEMEPLSRILFSDSVRSTGAISLLATNTDREYVVFGRRPPTQNLYRPALLQHIA